MAIFDSLINEAAEKFGLGDKAGGLLSGLLSLITSSDSGGITGFISKFTSAGLGNVVNSWVSKGENASITGDQLSSVLGNDVVNGIAEQAGVSADVAKPALAHMLPKVVDSLTPDGVAPTSIPDTLMNYISGLSGMLGKGTSAVTGAAGAALSGAADVAGSAVSGATDLADKGLNTAGDLTDKTAGAVGAGAAAVGAGVAGAAGAVGAGAKQAAEVASVAAKSSASWLLRILPLLLLLLAAFLIYQYAFAPQTPAETAAAPLATETVAPKVESTLQVVNADGKYKVTAVVPDEASQNHLREQLKAAYGEGKFEADIKVDPNAKPANWMATLGATLKEVNTPGAELGITGSVVTISGLAADAANALKTKLSSLFGTDFNINTKVLDPAAAVKDAATAASTALAGLKPGDAEELVKALNLQIINFSSGSNAVPKENEELLMKSAEAIKAAPADGKIEVGGYTDNTGNAAGNVALSQKRAEAVRAFLIKQGVKAEMLTAKGYGADNPVASNDTEEGRFKNRRIEFSVVK